MKKKRRKGTFHDAKTKALVCAFVFAYVENQVLLCGGLYGRDNCAYDSFYCFANKNYYHIMYLSLQSDPIYIFTLFMAFGCSYESHMSRPMGKPTICIGENKGTDQLRGNRLIKNFNRKCDTDA